MEYKVLRKEMRICRCVYNGTRNKRDAYLKNLIRINRSYKCSRYSKWLHKYNAELFETR